MAQALARVLLGQNPVRPARSCEQLETLCWPETTRQCAASLPRGRVARPLCSPCPFLHSFCIVPLYHWMRPRLSCADLVRARDYRGVNYDVWRVFVHRYGGYPPICRYELDVYSKAAPVPPDC